MLPCWSVHHHGQPYFLLFFLSCERLSSAFGVTAQPGVGGPGTGFSKFPGGHLRSAFRAEPARIHLLVFPRRLPVNLLRPKAHDEKRDNLNLFKGTPSHQVPLCFPRLGFGFGFAGHFTPDVQPLHTHPENEAVYLGHPGRDRFPGLQRLPAPSASAAPWLPRTPSSPGRQLLPPLSLLRKERRRIAKALQPL